jgi:hypothetical protein
MFRYLLVVLAMIALLAPAANAQRERRFWIAPNGTPDVKALFTGASDEWPRLRRDIAVFKMYIASIGSRRDSTFLKTAAATLRAEGIAFAVEAGGLRPFSGCDSLAGERHAATELQSFRNWTHFGGSLDYIAMDSPINTMIAGGSRENCGLSVARAASELADYMDAVRAEYPDVRFGWIEPVPWYRVDSFPNQPGNDYGDLLRTMDTVVSVLAARGLSLDFFHADSPFGYSSSLRIDGWRKLLAVETHARELGLRSGLIFNDEAGGESSDSVFYERTLEGWRRYSAVGGDPDDLIVQSWYPHPEKTLPETEPWTFTYTARRFIELVKGGAADRRILEPPIGRVYHGVGQYQQGVDDYIAAMEDSSKPILVKLYFDIPGTRGQNYAVLRQALARERAAGRIVELSLGLQDGRTGTDSVIATSTRYDAIIDSIATIVIEHGEPLFVRPGFEFNGPWFGYHPYLYPVAFRKIVDRFRARGVDSAAWVWCYYPSGAPNDFDSTDARGARWYPGDDYVDWFGLDLFNAMDFDLALPDYNRGTITSKGKSERFLAMARDKGRPVLLSETSATGIGITADEADGIADWSAWFEKFFAFIDAHEEIRGFNYINWDWRAYETWKTWGNSRIDSNAYILGRYRAEMRRPKYIHLGESIEPLPLPASPTLLFAADGAERWLVDVPVPFSWSRSGPAVDRYRLEVAEDSLFARMITDSTITDTTFRWFESLSNPSSIYWWRVSAHNAAGWSEPSEAWRFFAKISSAPLDESLAGALSITPNPSSGEARLRFELARAGSVRITLVDAAGRTVRVRREEHLGIGDHAITLALGGLASGRYSVTLETATGATTLGLVLTR